MTFAVRIVFQSDTGEEHSLDVEGPVELGRKAVGEDPLFIFEAHTKSDRSRIALAPLDDGSVSHTYALLEPLGHDRGRVTKISMPVPIRHGQTDAQTLHPGDTRELRCRLNC